MTCLMPFASLQEGASAFAPRLTRPAARSGHRSDNHERHPEEGLTPHVNLPASQISDPKSICSPGRYEGNKTVEKRSLPLTFSVSIRNARRRAAREAGPGKQSLVVVLGVGRLVGYGSVGSVVRLGRLGRLRHRIGRLAHRFISLVVCEPVPIGRLPQSRDPAQSGCSESAGRFARGVRWELPPARPVRSGQPVTLTEGGARTALITWITPFEAATFAFTIVAAPLRTILPFLSVSAMGSPSSDLTFAFFFAAAVAAVASTSVAST